jgi:hypothetical protein
MFADPHLGARLLLHDADGAILSMRARHIAM